MPSHSSVPLSDSQKAQWVDAIAKMDDAFLPAVALQDHDSPHKRVYFVAFDGTWNDRDNVFPGEKSTNPAQLEEKVSKLYDGDTLDGRYYEGVGTRTNGLNKLMDGMTGHGTEERAERAFTDFQEKASQWLKDDPKAQIHVVVTGFSRGAASARHFMNLLDERGVPADEGKTRVTPDVYSDIGATKTERVFENFLREPGSVSSSALLYDTVATGQENVVKLGIPPSTRFVVHITSQDENRPAFPLTSTFGGKQESFDDPRHLNISLPGVHSDIGGGYGEGVNKLGLYLGEQALYKLGLELNLGNPPYEALKEGMHKHTSMGLSIMDTLDNTFTKEGDGRHTVDVPNAPIVGMEKVLLEQDLRDSTVAGALRYIDHLESGNAPPDPNGMKNFAILLKPNGDGTMTVHTSDRSVVDFNEEKGTISVYGKVMRTLSENDLKALEQGEPIVGLYTAMPDHTKAASLETAPSTLPDAKTVAIESTKQQTAEKAERVEQEASAGQAMSM